jgi:hypothetical protein
VGSTLTGCVEDATVNPHAAPDHGEMDRLQTVIDDRPDLDVARQKLVDLDGRIRSVITQYSPQTEIAPSVPKEDHGCTDPYVHNVGDTFAIETIYARPGPDAQQWQQITAALSPALGAAGFRPNTPPNVPPAAGTFAWVSDDGSSIEMIDNPGMVLAYGYSTGCRLPAAWRTSQPPTDQRPVDDPDAHFPYLYGSPGGRGA